MLQSLVEIHELEEVARNAFPKDIFWNICKDLVDEHGINIGLGYSLLEYDVGTCVTLTEIKEDHLVVCMSTYEFELYTGDVNKLARILVRDYNVYSQVKAIRNPVDHLWSTGLFFIDF